MGLLRAVQGKTSSLLRYYICNYWVYILVRYDSDLTKDCSISFHTILLQSLQGEGVIHARSMCWWNGYRKKGVTHCRYKSYITWTPEIPKLWQKSSVFSMKKSRITVLSPTMFLAPPWKTSSLASWIRIKPLQRSKRGLPTTLLSLRPRNMKMLRQGQYFFRVFPMASIHVFSSMQPLSSTRGS